MNYHVLVLINFAGVLPQARCSVLLRIHIQSCRRSTTRTTDIRPTVSGMNGSEHTDGSEHAGNAGREMCDICGDFYGTNTPNIPLPFRSADQGHELFRIIVGKEPSIQTFTIHKPLLCKSASYFDRAFNGTFIEHQKAD
jgi:hypothetical protein